MFCKLIGRKAFKAVGNDALIRSVHVISSASVVSRLCSRLNDKSAMTTP